MLSGGGESPLWAMLFSRAVVPEPPPQGPAPARLGARWGSFSAPSGPISEPLVFLERSWHEASFAAIPRVWDPLGREHGPKGGSAGSLRGGSDD